MPDPSFDVAVANRFISSLSKSLQALCHGCMDFDSGIEIVGYINVNIDCGSKADYVLNEKVLKSTTNTMTFVSNSFLAKKDQPKQTRDGACSPIPQFGAAPYHHRTRGFPHSSYTARSAFHGAHYSRGGQKRGFSGEWRGPMKRPRPLPGDRVSLTQVPSSVLAQDVPTDTFNPSNLRQGQYQQSDAVSTSAGAEGDASMVNIKKEAFEGSDEAQPNQDENSSQQTNDSSELIKNIKSDPDANSPAEEENGSNTKTEATENDFKGTFLQPTQETQDNADAMQTSESGDQTSASEQTVGLETPFPNPPSLSDVADGAGASVMSESVGNFDAGGNELEDRGDNNDATVEYDNATEETSYSEYPDAGEGSSSGQFEVIEIDDEDEDMQAMFGASRGSYSSVQEMPQAIESSHARPPCPERAMVSFKPHRCSKCTASFNYGFSLQEHLRRVHNIVLAYTCAVCGKGYQTQSGLYYHVQSWHTKAIFCPVCEKKFSRKSTFRAHLLKLHDMKQCLQCSQCVDSNDFLLHRQSCSKNLLA